MYVYLLICTDKSTYVGATVDLNRRLRQHNKEIKGGAHITGTKVNAGKSWKRVCYVSGFPTWNAALQFEWRWKQLSRQLYLKQPPLERRIQALNHLLHLEKPTSNSVPYITWQQKPVIHIEEEIEICSIFLQNEEESPYTLQ